MARKFSFENAAFHFGKTSGDRGFLLPYLLTYVVLGTLVYAAMAYLMWPILSIYGDLFSLAASGASEAQIESILQARFESALGQIGLGILGAMLLGFLFYVVMEASIQRRYVLDQGFSLRFGGDELRLILVMIVFYLIIMAVFFVTAMLLGLLMMPFLTSPEVNPALFAFTMLLPLLAYIPIFYFAIKLAPAAALTVRDKQFRIFDAWRVTKSRWWAMLGSYIVLYLILTVAGFVLYFITGFALIGTFMGAGGAGLDSNSDFQEVYAIFNQPVIAIVGVLTAAVFMAFAGFCQYAWAGVAAIAAKDDPKLGGVPDAPSVFE